MRELLLFLAGMFGISVSALLLLGVCAFGLIGIVWLFWPGRPSWSSRSARVRYRAHGVVVHRAYSEARQDQVYVPGPSLMPFPLPGMEFLFLMPGPPILVSHYVPPCPYLLIEVDGQRDWLACNQEAYDRWPHNAAVLVEYELSKKGKIRIIEVWLLER